MADVYFNLHKHLFSVREKGRVIGHERSLCMRDVRFVVQPAGRQRVLDERRKNVHAFVRGERLAWMMSVNPADDWREVRYNPYEAGHFMLADGSRIDSADFVRLSLVDGKPQMLAWKFNW